MSNNEYRIPDEYFFRLNHVRPRFKNNIEDVLLYVANAIADMPSMKEDDFNNHLDKVLRRFQSNATASDKTIANWRTEISAIFSFIQGNEGYYSATKMAKRLAENQYLDEFFNYFLYTFQYPASHIKSQTNLEIIKAGIKFKPCTFVLELLIEGEKITKKPFSINAEELTQCAYYDLRVTRDGLDPSSVACQILENRKNKFSYFCKYPQLQKNKSDGEMYPSKGDIYRYAGDILDYMTLAGILTDKGTGFYYYLNNENQETIDYHLNNKVWFDGYDNLYEKGADLLNNKNISIQKNSWIDYVNIFDNINEFSPKIDSKTADDISLIVSEYYYQQSGDKKVSTKMIGDFGESLIMLHEFLRTKELSKRQHLINKIPTPLAVGYDIQSIEIEKGKRYIEVKTTKSQKALNNNKFKLTPNEWDTAYTLRKSYYIYYLMVNNSSKKIFVINDPVSLVEQNKLLVDEFLVVKFDEKSGHWCDLLEMNS